MTIEYVERLPEPERAQRWHVRVDGVPRSAWLYPRDFGDEDLELTRTTALPWRRFVHPRVAAVHSVDRRDDHLVIIVDDDRGPSLADAAQQLADTPVDRERWLVAQMITIADALAAMAKHQPGFVYNDLASDRLFVDPTGHARLRAPIGIAVRERSPNTMGAGVVFGSPFFMSPEHARGEKLTSASDVFALTSNLAYALTGEYPFDGEGFMTVLSKIITEAPQPARTYAPGLDRVLARGFEKQRSARYPDPAAFAAELYECVPDAGEYDTVLSDRIAAWWPSAPPAYGPMPHEQSNCSMKWDQLAPTPAANVRQCGRCNQPVVQVRTLAQAVPLMSTHCIHYKP